MSSTRQPIAQATTGQAAVLSARGAGGRGGVRAPGTRNLIEAMREHGVRRLISLSGLGAGKSRANLDFFWEYLMFGLLLRRAFADHVAQESHISNSGFGGNATGLKLKIPNADVADFMLNRLENDRYLRLTPGISY